MEKNERIAFVSVDGFIVDVLINDLDAQNRALDKDSIVLELYMPAKWQKIEKKGKGFKEGKIGNSAPIETRIVD